MLLLVAIIFVFVGSTVDAFTCQEKGIFENTDSSDCKTFIVCDSNLNSIVYSCNANTYFWPAKKGCFSQYDCAMGVMEGNADPCGEFSENIPDKSSADCTKYLTCSSRYIWQNSVYFRQVSSEQCPSGTAFRPYFGCINYHRCVNNFECTGEGFFENPDDCSSFIKCSKFENNMASLFYADLYDCPSGSKFNPHLKKCDSFYNCDGIDPHDGIDPCTDYNSHPFVVNPFDNSASSYIVCVHDFYSFIYETSVILRKECPAYSFFSPLLEKCYNDYDPNETCSKDPCSSGPGTYVDYASGHCASYIECRDDATTPDIYKPTYEIRYCPPGTRYTPETSDCNPQYVCPTFPVNYCYPQIPTTSTTRAPATTTSW